MICMAGLSAKVCHGRATEVPRFLLFILADARRRVPDPDLRDSLGNE